MWQHISQASKTEHTLRCRGRRIGSILCKVLSRSEEDSEEVMWRLHFMHCCTRNTVTGESCSVLSVACMLCANFWEAHWLFHAFNTFKVQSHVNNAGADREAKGARFGNGCRATEACLRFLFRIDLLQVPGPQSGSSWVALLLSETPSRSFEKKKVEKRCTAGAPSGLDATCRACMSERYELRTPLCSGLMRCNCVHVGSTLNMCDFLGPVR